MHKFFSRNKNEIQLFFDFFSLTTWFNPKDVQIDQGGGFFGKKNFFFFLKFFLDEV